VRVPHGFPAFPGPVAVTDFIVFADALPFPRIDAAGRDDYNRGNISSRANGIDEEKAQGLLCPESAGNLLKPAP
jgi:hypothetical protein